MFLADVSVALRCSSWRLDVSTWPACKNSVRLKHESTPKVNSVCAMLLQTSAFPTDVLWQSILLYHGHTDTIIRCVFSTAISICCTVTPDVIGHDQGCCVLGTYLCSPCSLAHFFRLGTSLYWGKCHSFVCLTCLRSSFALAH